MKKKYFIYGFVISLSFNALAIQASENETSKIIDKVIHAYGGKALIGAKSLKISEYNKGPWPGESENPGLPEIWRINEELTIDFENKRKSLLSYRVPRTTVDLEKWVFDGKHAYIYDIFHKKYSREDDWLNYNNLGGSLVRGSGVMHAKRLHSELKEAEYLGDEYYRGKPHKKLMVTMKSGAKFTYFIDGNTGLIRKMLRSHSSGTLVYVFSNYQKSDGLTYASDMDFFVNGELRTASVLRHIELNPDLEEAFKKPGNFTFWGEMIDNGEMAAKQIGKGVYQAGKGRAKTVFVEQGNHFIAIGGASALKENFNALKKVVTVDKPIEFFVITHHHGRNLRGLNNAIELGAKLVTSKAHKSTVERVFSESLPAQLYVVVPDRKPFKLGDLTLHDIPTAHSQHYLLVYSPDNKMVIAEEHYEIQLKTAKPRIYKDMLIFVNALKSLNIQVESLVDLQSWRKITMQEFTNWTQDFKQPTCPIGYEICKNG